MSPDGISSLRGKLRLTQEQFAQLLGVHSLTVSKWERGVLIPTPYQTALMHSFASAAHKQPTIGGPALASIMLGAGVAAALLILLKAALDGDDDDKPKTRRR